MSDFVKRLQLLLDEKNMKQRELANLAGVTEVTISRYLSGERNPRIEIVSKLAEVLNVSTDYLIGNTSDRISITSQFTNKDEKDISKRLAALENDLADQEMTLMMSGEVMDDETRELLKAALQHAVVVSKIKAKEKFNPNKNK